MTATALLDTEHGAAAALTPATGLPVEALTVPERWRWRTIAVGVVSIGAGAYGVVLVGPYANSGARSLAGAHTVWLLAAVALEILGMAAFALTQRRMLSATGAHVSLRRMQSLTYTSNAISVTVPGGPALASAVTFRALKRWGSTTAGAGFAIAASGLLSLAALPVVTVAVAYPQTVLAAAPLTVCAAVSAALVLHWARRRGVVRPPAVVTLLQSLVRRAARVIRRDPTRVLRRLREFLADARQVHPRRGDWAAGLGYSLVNWAAELGCLLACLHAAGASGVSGALVVASYLAGQGAASIAVTPGGLGVVDAAMIVILVHGGVPGATAAAAVIAFRLIDFAAVVAIGWALTLVHRYHHQRHRRPGVRAARRPFAADPVMERSC